MTVLEESKIRNIVLEFVHSETGWGNPLRPRCEFEDLYLDEIVELSDDRNKIVFRYWFDEDGFSQYDRTHGLEGMIIIGPSGIILESSLKEVHTGVGAVADPYTPKS